MVDGVDDPYPSLSDFHDYEPNLEFDDSDLLNTQHPEVEEGMYWKLLFRNWNMCNSEGYLDMLFTFRWIWIILNTLAVNFEEEPTTEFLKSPMADGTIEEDFEAALAKGRGVPDPLGDRGAHSSGTLGNRLTTGQESSNTADFSG